MSPYKLLNDNCKYVNNLSFEELSSSKTLMRCKSIFILKADKVNAIVIIGKDKYIQGVKNVISDSSKFIFFNIPPEDWINYIFNVKKKFRKLLIAYMAIIKSVKMNYSKFVL